jgi:hypothetical protein
MPADITELLIDVNSSVRHSCDAIRTTIICERMKKYGTDQKFFP